jgi:protein SCO1/2
LTIRSGGAASPVRAERSSLLHPTDPPRSSRRRRVALNLATIATLLLAAACSSPTAEEFAGTVLKNADAAFDFRLTDQFGRSASLQDHRGEVVVLTFLYTNCADVCPIVTNQLRDIYMQLAQSADGADDVAVLAVSVDPERDTVDEARTYLDKWGLVDDWRFLVGSREELAPIWKAYYLDPIHVHDDPTEPHSHDSPDRSASGGALDSLSQGQRYVVIHSTPVYLIDRQSRRRVVFTTPLDTEDVAHDIRLLLAD